MSCPSKTTFPLSAVSNPAMILRVVVLPHPLGPSKVKNSFLRIFNERLSKTVLSP